VRGERSFAATVILPLREPVPQPAFCEGRVAVDRRWLTKVNRLFDNMAERRVFGGERHPQLEFRAFDLASHEDCSCQPDWIINLPPETRMDRWPEPSSH
jgi:hypothetical protein